MTLTNYLTIRMIFVLWSMIGASSFALGQQVLFREDFDTPNLPANFVEAGHAGTRMTGGGSYLLTHTETGVGQMFAGVFGGFPTDHSVRMQARALEGSQSDWTYFGVFGRNLGGLETYFGGVGTNGNLFIGRATDTNITIIDESAAGLDTSQWINIQLDIVGEDIRLWGWEDGTAMPTMPQLAIQDSLFSSGDGAGLNYNLRRATNFPALEINYFEVTAIPEPSCAMLTGILSVFLAGVRSRSNSNSNRSTKLV